MPSCCCFPWRELMGGCFGALWRRVEAKVLTCCTICLCGQTVYTLPCGHSWHHRPLPLFPRCPICHSRGNDGSPSPVCSAAAALDEQEPLVLLPPPPYRFVHARGEQKQEEEEPPSSSSVQTSGSGAQELSSSSPPPS